MRSAFASRRRRVAEAQPETPPATTATAVVIRSQITHVDGAGADGGTAFATNYASIRLQHFPQLAIPLSEIDWRAGD